MNKDNTDKYIEISSLIIKEQLGMMEDNESTILHDWLMHNDNNQKIYKEFILHFDIDRARKKYSEINPEKIWERISVKIKEQKKPNKIIVSPFLRIAAIFIGIALMTGMFFYLKEKHYQNTRLAEVVMPGSNKAVLVTPVGDVIDLGVSADTVLTYANGVSFVNKNQKLVFQESSSKSTIDSNVKPYKVVVPKGGTYHVDLADGSSVWLNSESEMSFNDLMQGDERRVKLKGEAYFDIAPDKSRPFFVETESVEIRVLGTEFNIKDYHEDGNLMVSLVEGVIQAKVSSGINGQSVILHPDQQFNLPSGSINGTVKDVKATNYSRWRYGVFQFNNEGMESLLNQLARWYDVDFESHMDNLNQIKYTGELKRFENLSSILKLLEIGNDVEFEIRGHQVIVREK